MKLNYKRFVINLSTAGVYIAYCTETTAGARPTANYTKITGAKSTPSLNPSPETLETTTLDEKEYKTYIDGLKDLGGALEFTFNLTENLISEWGGLMDEYETAKAAGKATWFQIVIPGLTKSYFFTGNPSAMGLPETSVSAVLEITNYITPTNAPKSETKAVAYEVTDDAAPQTGTTYYTKDGNTFTVFSGTDFVAGTKYYVEHED